MIKVVDNFLSPSYFNLIEKVCLTDLDWTYTDNITDDSVVDKNQFGFSYPIYNLDGHINCPFTLILSGFLHIALDYVKAEKILRSRCDMTTHNPNKVLHIPHVDFEDPYVPNITTIFYITDNKDCETVIFNRKLKEGEDKSSIDFSKTRILKKVNPKRNRLVIFDGDYLHTGHSPTKENRRVLINTNFS